MSWSCLILSLCHKLFFVISPKNLFISSSSSSSPRLVSTVFIMRSIPDSRPRGRNSSLHRYSREKTQLVWQLLLLAELHEVHERLSVFTCCSTERLKSRRRVCRPCFCQPHLLFTCLYTDVNNKCTNKKLEFYWLLFIYFILIVNKKNQCKE